MSGGLYDVEGGQWRGDLKFANGVVWWVWTLYLKLLFPMDLEKGVVIVVRIILLYIIIDQ